MAHEGQLEEVRKYPPIAPMTQMLISYLGSTFRASYLHLDLLKPIDCYLRLYLLEFGIPGQ